MKESDKEKLAEICGAFIGDGWIESRGTSCYLAGHLSEDKEYYDKHIVRLFKETLIQVKPKMYPYWGVYGIGVHKKEIINLLVQLGIQKGKKVYSTEVPEWILSAHRKIKIAFLRGLFDTDGNFHCKKCYGRYDNSFRKKYHCQPRIVINAVSSKLMIQAFNILEELGLHPESIKSRVGKGNRKPSFIIKLNKLDEMKQWFEILKLSANPKHTTKYLLWKKFGFIPPKTTIEERKNILKGEIDIYSYYAGVSERSNEVVSRTTGLVPTKVRILSPA